MRRQTRCVGHEAGFGNDPSELQAKSTSIRERSSSLGQTIHRPRRDDRRSSPYQAQCSGTFVDDASAIGFWERLVQVNRLAIQANSFTEIECVFVGSGRIVAKQEVAVICVTHTPGVLTSPRKKLVISRLSVLYLRSVNALATAPTACGVEHLPRQLEHDGASTPFVF